VFDFTHGSTYVIGVGIAGGAVLRESDAWPRSEAHQLVDLTAQIMTLDASNAMLEGAVDEALRQNVARFFEGRPKAQQLLAGLMNILILKSSSPTEATHHSRISDLTTLDMAKARRA